MRDDLTMYYHARIRAAERDKRLSNRERAAEILYIGAKTLENYERGDTIPPCDVVQRMIEVYGVHDLKSAHICEHCPILTDYVPNTSPLAEAALGMAISFSTVQEISMQFAAIARDGKITGDELMNARLVRTKAIEIRNAMDASVLAIDQALEKLKREGS